MRRVRKSVGLIIAGGIVPLAILVILVSGLIRTPRAHSVALTWNAPRPVQGVAIVGYNVYRSTTPGGPYVPLALNVNGTAYKDMLVSSERSYYYVVRSVDSAGRESEYSEEIRTIIP
jgi:fibronectin type 3 domain-containing protein